MSWKSFVTAGLLCLLASPVFAAPTLSLVRGGSVANNHLNSSGQWVWNVNITPDYALVPDSSGTPVAAELGFAANGAVVSATMGSGFDTENPGRKIFGWEPNSTGTVDPANHFDGIKIGGTGNTQVSAALGSPNHTSGAKTFLVLTTARPVVSIGSPNTTSTITVSGAYSGNGRIAQITGGTPPNYTTGNFDTFSGTFVRNARGGDADLNGTVNFDDFQSNLLLNFGMSGKSWQHGDFDGNGTVNFDDFQILLTQYGSSYSVGGSAGGAAAASAAVPEPASLLLVLLGALPLVARRSRR